MLPRLELKHIALLQSYMQPLEVVAQRQEGKEPLLVSAQVTARAVAIVRVENLQLQCSYVGQCINCRQNCSASGCQTRRAIILVGWCAQSALKPPYMVNVLGAMLLSEVYRNRCKRFGRFTHPDRTYTKQIAGAINLYETTAFSNYSVPKSITHHD